MKIAGTGNLSYEEAYTRLEEAVAELSAGGLSLEEALRRFEQGMALAQYCSTLLDGAELRVQQVGQGPPTELAALLTGEVAPATSPEPVRGPLAGPAPRGRRGRPTPIGPAHKPPTDDLDPLFDDL